MIIISFLLGLAIFLYGMHELERGIREASDARLRHWLRSSTGTSLGSVMTGVFTTALLQSSSMVSLMVLAFAAAGILPLINSVGIILGANLGTTFTGWIVATLGFKLNLEAISLQLVAIGGATIVLLERFRPLRHIAVATVGLGLLLLGLGLMKTSMDGIPGAWNVSQLQGQPAVVYLGLGVVLAALIQSSSAVMMMGLAALNANLLALPEAAALIIGADLGTTSTTALGSLTGGPIKKQLALAHFLFNLIVDGAAFVLLLPLLPVITAALNISDPLYSLVAFHTIINLLGLLAFIPFIKPFTAFITRRVGNHSDDRNWLERVPPEVSDAAIAALAQATRKLVTAATVVSGQLMALKLTSAQASDDGTWPVSGTEKFKDNYEQLKKVEGEVLRFALQVQTQPLPERQSLQLDTFIRITRSSVYAVKTLKDIEHNLADLRYGEHKAMLSLYEQQRRYIELVSSELIAILDDEHPALLNMEKLEELLLQNELHHKEMDRFVHGHAQSLFSDNRTLSTELNVNREIHHSYKALIGAISDWLKLQDELATNTAQPFAS